MLRGENIICFAKDWREDPTSNNHVVRLLARDNRVLWVNSVSTRTPSLTSGRDVRKMVSKSFSFARDMVRGAQQVEENLWVFTPLVLPLPYSAAALPINRWIVKRTVRRLRRQLGFDHFQLWSFLPTAVGFVGELDESLVVYYVTDEYAQLPNMDTESVARMDREFCRRADIVFCTADSLLESRRPLNTETHLASHGVDRENFASALGQDLLVPSDIGRIDRPILGFFGLVHQWIDLDLIAYLAERRPDWSIVLIGNALVDVSRVARLPNVHLLGRKPYEQLAEYCKAFSVGLIPFRVNELTRHVNPIKLREYLSAGLPVVSTPLPEVARYGDLCYLASEDHESFLGCVERALAEDTSALRRKRSEAMIEETWTFKVEALSERVESVRRRKPDARTAA